MTVDKVIRQRLFPDITFTCNGSITKWIVGAGTGNGSSPPSELQIWRRSGQDYIIVDSTLLTEENQNPTNDPNVYEYIPSSSLKFQEGDILGVYTGGSVSPVMPYYQTTTGPYNVLVTSLGSRIAITYLYPLVMVETSGT